MSMTWPIAVLGGWIGMIVGTFAVSAVAHSAQRYAGRENPPALFVIASSILLIACVIAGVALAACLHA